MSASPYTEGWPKPVWQSVDGSFDWHDGRGQERFFPSVKSLERGIQNDSWEELEVVPLSDAERMREALKVALEAGGVLYDRVPQPSSEEPVMPADHKNGAALHGWLEAYRTVHAALNPERGE